MIERICRARCRAGDNFCPPGGSAGRIKHDASRRYGRLWRQGIPYLTLMENNINHPNEFGHTLFADSLIELFP